MLNSIGQQFVLLDQASFQLPVGVVINGFLELHVHSLFSELVVSGHDGVVTDSDLGRAKRNVGNWWGTGEVQVAA